MFFLTYLLFKIRNQPMLDEVEEEIDEINLHLDKLGNDLEVYIADIYDKVEGVLKPINKRLATRALREEEQDLNSKEPLKESGMISLQEARKRGIIK